MQKVPVILITGFLGAGKTTFINWLLNRNHGKKLSIILNEFGEIPIESEFIENKDSEMIELKNGCMCCIAKSDVPRAVHVVLNRAPDTDFLLIEASGLSEPGPIQDALAKDLIKDRVYLQAIICVIDAPLYLAQSREHKIINNQLSSANLGLLVKNSDASGSEMNQIKQRLHLLFEDLVLVEFDPELPVEIFLDKVVGDFDPFEDRQNQSEPEMERSGHDANFESNSTTGNSTGHKKHIHDDYHEVNLEAETYMSRLSLQEFFQQLPAGIIRGKGFFYDEQNKKILVQYVGGRVNFTTQHHGDLKVPSVKAYFVIIGNEDCVQLINNKWKKLTKDLE